MRTKLEPQRTPSHEELEFIRLMESYGKSEVGIKVKTLCTLIFIKELDQFHARELRYYQERYNQLKYTDITAKGRIINRNGSFKLICNYNPLKAKMQHRAYTNMICGIIDNRNSERIYGKMECKGQLDMLEELSTEELIKLLEVE